MSTTNYDYHYLVYCLTDSKWVDVITESSINPTFCSDNNTHVIDQTRTKLKKKVGPTLVQLVEEDTATGGNYKCDGLSFDIPANSVASRNIKYPFPINLLSATTTISNAHAGNVLDVYFIPDTIIGATTQLDGSNSDSIMHINSSQLQSFVPGLSISISDNTGSQSMGFIESINVNDSTLTVSGDPARPYAAGSILTATYETVIGTFNEVVLAANQIRVSDASKMLVGTSLSVAGVSVGTVLSVNNDIVVASAANQNFANGSVITSSFATTAVTTTSSTSGSVLQINCSTIGLQPGYFVSITDGVNTDELGIITEISSTSLLVSIATIHSFASGSTLIVQYNSSSVLIQTYITGTIVSVDNNTAEKAFVGVFVSIDSQNMGTVTNINGTELTVSGNVSSNILPSEIRLSYPNVTAGILIDCMPLNIFKVTDSVVQYAQVGMSVKVHDNVGKEDLGRIVAIDSIKKYLTTELEPSRIFNPASMIEVTRYYIQNLEFGAAGTYGFSEGRNKGSYIESGRTGCVQYTNNSNSSVRFTLMLQYLY